MARRLSIVAARGGALFGGLAHQRRQETDIRAEALRREMVGGGKAHGVGLVLRQLPGAVDTVDVEALDRVRGDRR